LEEAGRSRRDKKLWMAVPTILRVWEHRAMGPKGLTREGGGDTIVQEEPFRTVARGEGRCKWATANGPGAERKTRLGTKVTLKGREAMSPDL